MYIPWVACRARCQLPDEFRAFHLLSGLRLLSCPSPLQQRLLLQHPLWLFALLQQHEQRRFLVVSLSARLQLHQIVRSKHPCPLHTLLQMVVVSEGGHISTKAGINGGVSRVAALTYSKQRRGAIRNSTRNYRRDLSQVLASSTDSNAYLTYEIIPPIPCLRWLHHLSTIHWCVWTRSILLYRHCRYSLVSGS